MMSWKMYLLMIAFLTVMLAVFFMVAWPVVGNVTWQYRKSRENRVPGDEGGLSFDQAGWKLPLWKSVLLALAAAWLVVHFIVLK